jgi:hypothetical protein
MNWQISGVAGRAPARRKPRRRAGCRWSAPARGSSPQLADLRGLAAGDPGRSARIDVGLAEPLAPRLRAHPQPASDRGDRRVLRRVLPGVLADQCNCPPSPTPTATRSPSSETSASSTEHCTCVSCRSSCGNGHDVAPPRTSRSSRSDHLALPAICAPRFAGLRTGPDGETGVMFAHNEPEVSRGCTRVVDHCGRR